MALRRTSHRIKASRYMKESSTLAQQLRTQPSSDAVKSQKAATQLQPYPDCEMQFPAKMLWLFLSTDRSGGMASSSLLEISRSERVAAVLRNPFRGLFSTQQTNPEIFLGRPSNDWAEGVPEDMKHRPPQRPSAANWPAMACLRRLISPRANCGK